MHEEKMSIEEQKGLSDLILKEKREKEIKQRGRPRKSRCTYCGKIIEWGNSCDDCGYKEDKALGKVD